MFSRTIPSASAKMGRRISPWNNLSRCGRCRASSCSAGRRQRSRRSVARRHRAQASAGLSGAEPPAAADARPDASTRRPPASRAAPTCWRMHRAAKPTVILIGTGSEVSLCVDAYERLTREGIAARVVSMPSWEMFEQQDQTYRDSVLPPE